VYNPQLGMDELLEFAELIAQIIDFRSRFTATHSKGVAATSAFLAKRLGFDAEMQKFVYLAGLLHDLGKLAVPSEIIEKAGPLDEIEMEVMRRHTVVSDQLLREIPGFGELADMVSCHHERLDGSGYPFRYTGDRLNLPCRIMAVADIFTAITEDRPYRKGMDRERSLSVLEELAAGELIDPAVVFVVKNEYDALNEARVVGQDAAHKEFKSFYTA
jgi:putative nucleotidyltransferase with HDIG domain